jgi:hypothetical protein
MEDNIRYAIKIFTVFILAALLIIGGSLFIEHKLPTISTKLQWSLVFESTPLKANCIFDRELLINQNAMMKISFDKWWDGEQYTVNLTPSDGLTIIDNLNWTGNFTLPREIFYNLSVDIPGYYSISVKIIHDRDLESGYYGYNEYATDIISFEVTDSKMIIDSYPYNNWYPSNYGGGVGPMDNINEKLTGNITLSNTPFMNEEVLLVYTFHTSIDLLDSSRNQLDLSFPPKGFEIIEVIYPPNGGTGELVDGELFNQYTWMGEIHKNKTYQLSVKFKVIEEGSGNIVCSLVGQIQYGIHQTFQERNSVWLSVNKYTATYVISK